MSRPLSTESVYRAVAHESRRRVLELLARREMSATEIARQFKHSQPTLSNHLRVLDRCGLVSCRRQGVRVIYRLEPSGLASMRKWLDRVTASARH